HTYLYVIDLINPLFFFFSSRRRHTRSLRDWSSDVCSSDLQNQRRGDPPLPSALILARSGLQDSSCRGMFRNNGSSPNLKRLIERSEERRVGKECRYRWSP